MSVLVMSHTVKLILFLFHNPRLQWLLLRPLLHQPRHSPGRPTHLTPPRIDSTSEPTSSCTGNTLNWIDSHGDGCDWYKIADLPGCPLYGSDYEGSMGVANDNCCHCSGTAVSYVACMKYCCTPNLCFGAVPFIFMRHGQSLFSLFQIPMVSKSPTPPPTNHPTLPLI